MKPRIRSSIGVVKLNDNTVEFFRGNIRRSIVVKINESIIELICSLDGTRDLKTIEHNYSMDSETAASFEKLISFLVDNHVVVDREKQIFDYDRQTFSRVFSMLEDYLTSEEEIQNSWRQIRNSKVLIVGLGAVGTWVTANLVQSGVQNIILMDNDVVELSNLHRQWGFTLQDVGKTKTNTLRNRLLTMDSKLNIETIDTFLDANTLEKSCLSLPNLIINCADKPTVDQTAEWVGAFCMKHLIPHIIAGGYNLHLSLIGQTIIPFETACIKCFEKQLREKNEVDTVKMKKLVRENRKIGSFGPMCAISASFASLEALKVLSGVIKPSNCNRRGEFNIYAMDTKYHFFEKLNDCEWCGENGLFRR